MRRTAELRYVLLVLALVACRPTQRTDPPELAPAQAAASEPLRDPPRPPPLDLGPPDPTLPSIFSASAEPYALPSPARAVLYGRMASRAASRPATGDEPLRVAVHRPTEVFARGASYLHVAAWRPEGQPAAGARVFVGDRQIGRTDRHGALVIRQPVTDSGDTEAERRVWVLDGDRCGSVELPPVRATPGLVSDHLHVHTDRALYRPGETIHLRTIGWSLREDYRALANADVEYLLRNDGGHTIAAATQRTDDLGISAVDLPVPLDAREGRYTLVVLRGDERASARLQVRDLVRPILRIEHTLPRTLSMDRRTLDFDLRLGDPDGTPPERAKIEIDARAGGKRLVSLRTDVEGEGPHTFTFHRRDLDRLRDVAGRGGLVTVALRVTDEAGRRDEIRTQMRITATSSRASLELDRDEHATGDPVVVVARVTDLERVPRRQSAVELHLEGGETPLVLDGETNGGGVATFRFDMPAQSLQAALRVPDAEAALARAEIPWAAARPMQVEVTGARPSPGSRIAGSLRESEPAEIVVRLPSEWTPVEDVVHVDVIDASGAIVGAALLPLELERGAMIARGRIVAPMWGTARLASFVLGRQVGDKRGDLDLLTDDREIVVAPDRTLEVTVLGLPKTVRPGATIDARVRVHRRSGKTGITAVGAAIVDTAMLGGDEPGTFAPGDLFDPPRRVGMVPDLPVLVRNWGSDVDRGDAIERCSEAVATTSPRSAGAADPGRSELGRPARRRPVGPGVEPRPIRTEITIRARAPSTKLWAPHLRGEGEIAVQGSVGDALGEVALVVVASDAAGGVGVAKAKVRVTQPLAVRLDAPSSLVVGDHVELPVFVHNSSDHKRSVAIELRANGEVQDGEIDVPARRQETLALPLDASAPGPLPVDVRATDTDETASAQRAIVVRSPGLPVTRTSHALAATESTTLPLVVPAGDRGHQAHLEILFPAIATAQLGVDAADVSVTDDVDRLAIDLSCGALLLQADDDLHLDQGHRDSLRGRTLATVAMLRILQRTDGAFAERRGGRPSSDLTARILEGLLDAVTAGIAVPASMMDRLGASLKPTGGTRGRRSTGGGALVAALASSGRAALRDPVTLHALLEHGAPLEELAATIEVRVDDQLVQTFAIDPGDPQPALEALAHVDLGGALAPGRHVVEARVQGRVWPVVRLVQRVWTPGAAARAEADAHRLEASGDRRVPLGARTHVRIRASGPALGGGTIRVAKSGLFEVDRAELSRWVGAGGPIRGFHRDDEALVLELEPRARDAEIAVPLRAVRRGTGGLPAIALDPLSRVGADPRSLVVDPGPVTVE